MDRTLACEAENLGSTPNGCTNKNCLLIARDSFYFVGILESNGEGLGTGRFPLPAGESPREGGSPFREGPAAAGMREIP